MIKAVFLVRYHVCI